MIQIGCKKHPRYAAIRKPLGPPNGCYECNLLWRTVQASLYGSVLGGSTFNLSHFLARPGKKNVA